MKGKSQYRRARRKFKKRGYRFKKKRDFFAKREMIRYYAGSYMPISPRYQCKMKVAVIANETVNAPQSEYRVKFNSIFHPFDTTDPLPNIVSPGSINLQPVGSKMLGKNYFNFRVYASKIKLTVAVPNDILTSYIVTVVPSSFNPGTLAAPVVLDEPLAKNMQVTGYQGPKTIIYYCPTTRVAGVSRSAIENDLSGEWTGNYGGGEPSADPTAKFFWVISWTSADGGNLAPAQMSIQCEVIYYVESWGLTLGAVV